MLLNVKKKWKWLPCKYWTQHGRSKYKGNSGRVCAIVFRPPSVTSYSLQHLLCFSMFAVPCKEKPVILVLQAPIAADWDILRILPAVKPTGLHLSPKHILCNPFCYFNRTNTFSH